MNRILLSPEDSDLAEKVQVWYRKGSKRAEAVIWSRRRRPNPVYRRIMKRMLQVRRLPRGMHVDHINGNPLDNRRSNLRLVTPQQNAANRKPTGKGSSQYKGVYWDKKRQCWRAQIGLTAFPRRGRTPAKHVRVCLGRFNSEEAAAHAYNETAAEWFGEYACLNQIEPGD